MLHHPLLGWAQCGLLQLMVMRAVAELVVDVEAVLSANRRVRKKPRPSSTWRRIGGVCVPLPIAVHDTSPDDSSSVLERELPNVRSRRSSGLLVSWMPRRTSSLRDESSVKSTPVERLLIRDGR